MPRYRGEKNLCTPETFILPEEECSHLTSIPFIIRIRILWEYKGTIRTNLIVLEMLSEGPNPWYPSLSSFPLPYHNCLTFQST